jgi:hypothetical protein
MFQYPGQNPLFPVQNGQTRFVFPAPLLAFHFGNLALLWYGAFQLLINPDGLMLTNQSLPSHIFHDGTVVRSYSQREDGAWIVTTTGEGTNVHAPLGAIIDQMNEMVGPSVFTTEHLHMQVFIRVYNHCLRQ